MSIKSAVFIAITITSTLCSFQLRAALVNVSGSFSADNFIDDFGSASPPVISVSGTFSFQYDDTSISQFGLSVLSDFTPISVSSNVGSINYNETNTLVTANFNNGTLTSFFLGGSLSGANGISANTSDIAIGFNNNIPSTFVYTLSGSTGRFRSNPPNYVGDMVISTVPIPAAVWLFGSGLLGLIGIARRKKS